MSGFIGMDSREVRRVAASLRVQSQHVGTILGAVESLVSQSASSWHGPDSSDFAHAWTSSFRPRLHALRGWLEEMAAEAGINADQQDGTSRAGGGLAAAGSMGGGVSSGSTRGESGWLDEFVADTALYGGFLLGKAVKFSGNGFSMGKYGNGWQKVLRWGDGHGIPEDLLRFKRSPVFHFLNDHQGIFKAAGKATDFLSAVDMIGKTSDLFDHVGSGDGFRSTGDLLELGGSALGFVKATPVTYLGSVALKTWGSVAHEAAKTDFSWAATTDTFSYAANNLGEVGDSFGDAAVQIFTKDMWGWL